MGLTFQLNLKEQLCPLEKATCSQLEEPWCSQALTKGSTPWQPVCKRVWWVWVSDPEPVHLTNPNSEFGASEGASTIEGEMGCEFQGPGGEKLGGLT